MHAPAAALQCIPKVPGRRARPTPAPASAEPRPQPRRRKPRLGLRSRGLVLALLLSLEAACRSAFAPATTLPSPPELPAGAPALALPAEGIDVLVWNVKKAERAALPGELSALVQDKELVLLQEAYAAPRLTTPLAARGDLQWLLGPSFAFAWREGSPATGVAIGSAARALDQRAFVSPDTEPLLATPKAALVATYPLHDRPERLLVVCVHAINFRPADALAAQLQALAPAIAEHRGPVLLAGDFNTHHRPRMAVLQAFAARHGLRSAFDNGDGAPPPDDMRTRFGPWPLDHLYVRDLVIEHARVVADARGSDHKPLVVRLSAEPPPAEPPSRPAAGAGTATASTTASTPAPTRGAGAG